MLEDRMTEKPEEIFFRYAFSCGAELLELKLIGRDIYTRIESFLSEGKTPDREFLEATYPNAIKRIQVLALTLGRDKWDSTVIRQYFIDEHNKVIDNVEGNYRLMSPQNRELCKVRVGVIKDRYLIKDKLLTYIVDYGDKTEEVVGKYLPDADIGDKITTHWRFAIEKLE